jgi:hypothetical protein
MKMTRVFLTQISQMSRLIYADFFDVKAQSRREKSAEICVKSA